MSVSVFHAGVKEFGFLMSAMAIGSVAGALLSAKRAQPRVSLLLCGALIFGICFTLGAFMPNYWLFGLTLVFIGISSQTFTTTANSTMQLATESAMRGRVMAIYLALLIGGSPIGAPFVDWIADTFGPRWSLGVDAISGFAAAIICFCYLFGRRQNAGRGA